MKTEKTSRRDLLKTTAVGGFAIAASSLVSACSPKKEQVTDTTEPDAAAAPAAESGGLEYVDANSGKAKALRYVENGDEASTEVRVDKGKTPGTEQYCNNCQFYSEGDESGGKCALFPGKKVPAKAWCVSWSLKAQS